MGTTHKTTINNGKQHNSRRSGMDTQKTLSSFDKASSDVEGYIPSFPSQRFEPVTVKLGDITSRNAEDAWRFFESVGFSRRAEAVKLDGEDKSVVSVVYADAVVDGFVYPSIIQPHASEAWLAATVARTHLERLLTHSRYGELCAASAEILVGLVASR